MTFVLLNGPVLVDDGIALRVECPIFAVKKSFQCPIVARDERRVMADLSRPNYCSCDGEAIGEGRRRGVVRKSRHDSDLRTAFNINCVIWPEQVERLLVNFPHRPTRAYRAGDPKESAEHACARIGKIEIHRCTWQHELFF